MQIVTFALAECPSVTSMETICIGELAATLVLSLCGSCALSGGLGLDCICNPNMYTIITIEVHKGEKIAASGSGSA